MARRFLEIGPAIKGRIGPDWDTMNLKRKGFAPPDVIGNLREPPLPIPDKTYEIVYASHVLEHLPWCHDIIQVALLEMRRILIIGGIVELWVPDFDAIMAAKDLNFYQKQELIFAGGQRVVFSETWHKSAWNEALLRDAMLEAGFTEIYRPVKPRGIEHPYNLGLGGWKWT